MYIYCIYIYTCVCIAPKINEAFQWISRGHLFVLKVVYVRPNFKKKINNLDFRRNFWDPISRNQKKYYQNSAAKKVVFSVENSPAFTAQHRDGFRANDFRHFRPFFFAPISTEIWSEHKGFSATPRNRGKERRMRMSQRAP